MANKGIDNSGKLLHCNFCEKSQHEVRHLIAGPSVYICGECVELCINIINENKIKDIAPLNKSSHRKTKNKKDKNKVGEESQ